MATAANPMDILDHVIATAVDRGLGHLIAENERFDGRTVRIRGRPLLNFGSCSYLGLELDPRLIQAAIDAVTRFGAHFSSSRAYVSAPLYRELEELVEQIFGGPCVVMPTTTLGHLGALPVLCAPGDAAIVDHQAHHSLHMAANQVRAFGAQVELVRHGRLDLLEEKIEELARTKDRVWYVADGVYSMYGDCAPMDALMGLVERHPKLHLYLDDAHGVSWCGERGEGFVLGHTPRHERLVVATTLGKSFGAGGAVIVLPTREWQSKIRNCGGPLIFAGPIPPAMLGAAIASAKIHLSSEIHSMQEHLRERVSFCNDLCRKHQLPLVADTLVPLRFVGTGLPSSCHNLVEALMEEGFYANSGQFPAVPMKRSGVRFTLTLHHTLDDIERFVGAMAKYLPAALESEDVSVADVCKTFGLEPPASPVASRRRDRARRSSRAPLSLQHESRIAQIPTELWDRCLAGRGSFSAEGLTTLERIFVDNRDQANDWRFHYYMVRDDRDQPLLATFFTEAIWKDDMLAPASVSELVESRRSQDPDLLTSRVLSMGSLLTEGDHLFLDRSRDWQAALGLLLSGVAQQAEACDAKMIALRDLPGDDEELARFLERRGFTRVPLPESAVLEIDWDDDEEYMSRLSSKSRYHQRHQVLPWEKAYEVEVLRAGGRTPSDAEFEHFQRLYRDLKSRNLSLNTFDLPENFYRELLRSPAWELVLLRLRPEFGGEPGGLPVAVGACFVGPSQYAPMVLGLDGSLVRSHGLYRQCLLQALRRARHHGLSRIYFGMGAPLEKRRFGARQQQRVLYVQTDDHYHLDLLAAYTADASR